MRLLKSTIFFLFILTIAADISASGFVIGGSMTGRRLIGKGFASAIFSTTSSSENSGYGYPFTIELTDANSGFGLANNRITGLAPVIGYRFFDRVTFLLSYVNFSTKNGEASPDALNKYYPNLSHPYTINKNSFSFSQKIISSTVDCFIAGKSLFVTAGLEFNNLKITQTRTITYSEPIPPDNIVKDEIISKSNKMVIGWLLGVGLEQKLNRNFALTTVSYYSFSRYRGAEDFFGELAAPIDLDLSGVSIEFGLNYFVR